MNFDLELYHSIIFLGLNPKKIHTKNNAYFKQLFQSVKKEVYLFHPIYDVDFEQPFTPKRKYNHTLIQNEAIRYLNNVFLEFQNANSINERKYLFNAFNSIITQKFNEVYSLCKKENYSYSRLKEGIEDLLIEDEVYIIQYLKTELIRIYLEVAEKFGEYNTNDSYTIENIYRHFFKEKLPSPNLLIEAVPQIDTKLINHLVKNDNKEKFTPIQNDLTEVPKGILPFKTIVDKQEYFSIFEDALFTHGLIDTKYKFVETHGLQKEMGIIYAVLIQKNYFHKRDFEKQRPIKPIDIKKFLNNRYKTTIDREFRNAMKNNNLVRHYLDSNFWLENLRSF